MRLELNGCGVGRSNGLFQNSKWRAAGGLSARVCAILPWQRAAGGTHRGVLKPLVSVGMPRAKRRSGHGRAGNVTPLDRTEGEIMLERNRTMRKLLAVVTTVLVGVVVVGQGPARADQQSLRPDKRGPVSLRLATSTPVRDYEELTLDRQTVYVIPRATLADGNVASAEAIATRSGSDVSLTLTEDGAEWLAAAIDTHGADRLVIFVGRKPLDAGGLSFDAAEGSAKVTGLSAEHAVRLVRVLNRITTPRAGATFTVVPGRTAIQPGEAVNLDVFLSGASNVRSYQLTLSVSGGASGRLTVDDLWVDSQRADYVFGALQKLDAVDRTGARIGAVLMQGGVEAVNSRYVGSYTVRASSDASGVFNVNLRLDNNASILWSSNNLPIPFGAGPAAAISVGTPTRVQPTQR